MLKEVIWRDNLTTKPETNIHGVSNEVQVFTSRGRVLSGYWDSHRKMWFLNGALSSENVVKWTNLLETIE